MIPMAKGSYKWNLGQIEQHVLKLSIKACGEEEVLEEVAREQGSECGFLYKTFELSKACRALERGQYMQEELKKKMRIFREKRGELAWLAWSGYGGMEWLKGDPRESPCMA